MGIGWVPDDRRIFPTLTVARNLAIAKKRTRFRAWSEKECFEIFSALEYLMARECENLSGGEMQMVAISRALLGAPGLVLFDEPSQGLAPKVVQDVMATVLRLKREGVGVMLVEQNVKSALAVADRVCVMRLGRIVHEGPAAALRDDPALQRRWLGVLNVETAAACRGAGQALRARLAAATDHLLAGRRLHDRGPERGP